MSTRAHEMWQADDATWFASRRTNEGGRGIAGGFPTRDAAREWLEGLMQSDACVWLPEMCPVCRSRCVTCFGLAHGGYGFYVLCESDECGFFAKDLEPAEGV